MKKREERRDPDGVVHPQTRDDFLSPHRLRTKLQHKQKTIRAQALKIGRLKERLNKILKTEAVPVDEELSNELKTSMKDAPAFVKIFWEQQQKAHAVQGASGMKWHPLLIRWALHVKSISSSAYSAMRDSGFIKLPSERTLYEYSHANPAKEGIQHSVIKRLAGVALKNLSEFFTYFVLMFDEMYIFRNVVYNKGTGEIVGYANLDSVEEELRQLENQLGEESLKEDSAPVAKTMLTYMSRNIGGKDHGVVACFPTGVLTKEILHSRTWDVIEALELAGIKVILLVADGHPVNIAFIYMHKPLTILPSGVIFDTLNIYSLDRPLYFMTDLPHLLKTIRNCFSNSGAHKNTRMLMKNSEHITWKTIIACYKSEEAEVLKCCHKLTPQNVFLNSYSVMKVSLAAQVMSRTVALYIRDVLKLNRPETIKFILLVNDWFDCMNGKYKGQDIVERNPNLAIYNDENDKRFDFLFSFLQYLDEWKAEVEATNIPKEEKQKRILSHQTLDGIERTTHGFVATLKYTLGKRRTIEVKKKDQTVHMKEGYILGRTLQQDEEEHYFSRQRGMGGGNVHPSVPQFLQHQTVMEAHGNLGMKRARGNTEGVARTIDVDAPVEKRKKVNRKLDLSENWD